MLSLFFRVGPGIEARFEHAIAPHRGKRVVAVKPGPQRIELLGGQRIEELEHILFECVAGRHPAR